MLSSEWDLSTLACRKSWFYKLKSQAYIVHVVSQDGRVQAVVSGDLVAIPALLVGISFFLELFMVFLQLLQALDERLVVLAVLVQLGLLLHELVRLSVQLFFHSLQDLIELIHCARVFPLLQGETVLLVLGELVQLLLQALDVQLHLLLDLDVVPALGFQQPQRLLVLLVRLGDGAQGGVLAGRGGRRDLVQLLLQVQDA